MELRAIQGGLLRDLPGERKSLIMLLERLAEDRHFTVPVDPSELLFRLQEPGRSPAQYHLAVPPALDVAGDRAPHGNHGLDRVGGFEGA